jgi:KDO2-lipid IV(A) lauroyltransferase
MSEYLGYFFIRALAAPFGWLPYRWLRRIGRIIGRIAFYCMHDYRKRSLCNLALASDLSIQSEQELIEIAKKSFENLAINLFEYPRFAREPDLSRIIHCENPQAADDLYRKGYGIIFFCGHLSNWEVLFLDGTRRMKGIAIGKAIKNKRLYRWVVQIREKNGGKIIAPRNALREGLKALRKGTFVGIVGDQGMPDSGYSFPFLGRRAWTTTAPALLAYKTNSPIIVATTRRVEGGYRIRYSDPIWPNANEPLDKEVVRMMDQSLTILQESIKASPGEWLWQHNRWKQQTPHMLYKRFRKDSLCIILPDELGAFSMINSHLPVFREIYPRDFLFLIVPSSFRNHVQIAVDEKICYSQPADLFRRDYRFKLVFNFSSYHISRHYKKLGAFEVFQIKDLQKIALQRSPSCPINNYSEVLKCALCRSGGTSKNLA